MAAESRATQACFIGHPIKYMVERPGTIPLVFPLVDSTLCDTRSAVYALFGWDTRPDGATRRLLGFSRRLDVMSAQQAKASDRDCKGGEVFLNQACHYIGLIRGEQMTILSIGARKHRRIIHGGLILQGHELHGLALFGGDNLLGQEPPNERHFLPHILP
jgi:hypothetical protein